MFVCLFYIKKKKKHEYFIYELIGPIFECFSKMNFLHQDKVHNVMPMMIRNKPMRISSVWFGFVLIGNNEGKKN